MYAAKLLFQYRFHGESPEPFRMVEERIVLHEANSAEDAYGSFRERAKAQQRKFRNDDGLLVWFEFVGILDMIHLGLECEDNEVWYDIRKMKTPMERKASLVPKKEDLPAIRLERRR